MKLHYFKNIVFITEIMLMKSRNISQQYGHKLTKGNQHNVEAAFQANNSNIDQ